MFIVNWRLPSPPFSIPNLAWLGGFMLVFWAPFWGGQRVPVLFLLVLGLLLHIRTRKLIPAPTAQRRWGIIFLLLWLPCLLSAPFSLVPNASFTLCLVLLLHFWVGYALLTGLEGEGHTRLAWGIGLTLLFWSVDGAIQLTVGRDLFGVQLTPQEIRITGPFEGNLHMSLFICVMMPLLLWPLARVRPWSALFLFAFMSTVAFLSGARTSLAFSILVALMLLPRLPAWKYRAILLPFCLIPLLAIPLSPILLERVMQRDYLSVLKPSNSEVARDSLFDKVNHLLSGRLWIWETAGNMLLAHPLVGVGPAAFDSAYPQYATRTDDPFRIAKDDGKHAYHAHQMYIGSAAETGLLGLSGLLTCIFLVGRWYRSASLAARARGAPYLACLAIIAFPINSQPVLFSGWWFPIVLLLLCGLLSALEERTARHTPTQQ